MPQRSFRILTLAALAAALGACQSAAPRQTAPQPPAAPAGPPNIVLLLMDDMDVAALAHMPTVQAELVAKGTTFTNAFVTTSVCCPSRASILTGQYAHNHGVLDNRPPLGGFVKFFESGKESSTIATWLKDAGYRTALIGKYLNLYPRGADQKHVPPGWDEWRALFHRELYYDYKMNENGTVTSRGDKPEDYQTDVLRRLVLEFVDQAEAQDGRPFFLHVSPYAPHRPAQPAPRHEEALPGLKGPRPPSYNEEDVSDKPAWVRQQAPMTPELMERTDWWFRRRAQTLLAVDELLAALLARLRQRGELDNTYVFFTSDNGFEFGAHRMDHGKADPYEASIRVPLVARGPGVPAGQKHDAMVLNIDLAPTFAELGRAQAADFVDGRSFAAFLHGRAPAGWREDFLIEQFGAEEEGEGSIPNYFGLRTRDHVYIEYPTTGERELYDLRRDPDQMESLHDKARPALTGRLAGRLAALRDCRAEGCRK
jgi:arylsulfatase A-like enzyme